MQKIYIFLGEGYADWETAFIAAELNNPHHGFMTRTVATTTSPLCSMGGFDVIPDHSANEAMADMKVDLQHTAMLILCGGLHWKTQPQAPVKKIIDFCFEERIPLAAICDAVTFLANNGYLDSVSHTGNTLKYLKSNAPNYRGEHLFVETQALTDGNLITANGLAPLEFSREILRLLKVKPNTDYGLSYKTCSSADDAVSRWYNAWKNGYFPNS